MNILDNISQEALERAILKGKKGVEQYIDIMKLFNTVNVSEDIEFQKKFNGFYKMIKRTPIFYKTYYTYMESVKNDKNLTFDTVVNFLYKKTNKIEKSFSSKLLATINPNYPIWDQFVLKNLGLKVPSGKNNTLNVTINLYDTIIEWYKDNLHSNHIKNIIETFNSLIPNNGEISDIKKLDFILWQIRE